MIQYQQFLTEKIHNILNNLAINYTKTQPYLDLNGLKSRAQNDLFVISRVLQRFILTMALDNINTSSVIVYQRISWLNREIVKAYHDVMNAVTDQDIANVLQTLNSAFQESEESFVNLITQHNNAQRTYYGYGDIDDIPRQFRRYLIPEDVFQNISRTSHHTNVFAPYIETVDADYINTRDMWAAFAEKFSEALHLHGFSSRDNEWRDNYYKYLSSEWTHCDVRYNTFDAVFMTHRSAFGTNYNMYKRLYNYARHGGTIIIYGLRSDFLPSHLERLAKTLENIHISFFSHSAFAAEAGGRNDFCFIFGKKNGDVTNWITSYNMLMEAFLTGDAPNTYFAISGSETEVTPFRSYNITEEEYRQLIPILSQSEKGITQFLFPKKQKDTRRPLLPFTSGQLGLVLISGDINGIIEEPDTHCRHAVKGSSSRTSSSSQEAILNDQGITIGRKEVRISYPITTVQLVTASGEIKEIGGRMSS